MIKRKIYLLIILLPVWIFSSCVKDVDFDQSEDIVITPVFELAFVYSSFNTKDYEYFNLDPSITIPEVVVDDTLDFDFLSIDFSVDNLEKVELTFEFANTIKRDFEFSFTFLNNENKPVGKVYKMLANSGLGENEEPVITTKIIELDRSTIKTLSTAKRVALSTKVENVNSTLKGKIELRSKGTYFVNYKL